MISEMALDDIDTLTSRGINLTPREIIILNSLGVKAEHYQDSYSFYTIPRCVFLGDVVLREPSIGAEVWYDSVSRQFNLDDDFTVFTLKAYMMSKDVSELPKWYHISQLQKELKHFLEKDIKDYTIRQLINAVNYCIYGNNPNDEKPLIDIDKKEEEKDLSNTSISIGVVREAQALALGISLDDAYKMTQSELQAVIMRAYKLKDFDVDKSIKNQSIGEYYSTLQKIKTEHLKNG